MSICLGNIQSGSPYQVKFDAPPANKQSAFVFITWVSPNDDDTKSYVYKVDAGDSGLQALNCPAGEPHYLSIDVRIRLAAGDTGTLALTGLMPPNPSPTVVAVAATGEYWANIV
jgi:hypothetical protein